MKYDIIASLGLICHMMNVEDHINSCLDNCQTFILETEILDRDINTKTILYEGASDTKPTTSLPDSECADHFVLYSEKYIGDLLEAKNFKFNKLKFISLNTGDYIYNWKGENDPSRRKLRTMWVAWRKDTE